MKKILLLILMTAAVIWWFNRPDPVSQPRVSPSPVTELESVAYRDKIYRFAHFIVDDPTRLNLIVNTDFEATRALIDRYQCRYLVNGGFYDENNQPLGWLVSQGQELSAPIISRLLDGFLATNGQAFIDFTQSEDSVRSAVQSGPMLVFESALLNLNIANDELRRRVVALLTADQHLIFLSVVGQDSELSGPYLADLPDLVLAIADQLGLSARAAINLDGGTASAFYTDKVYLKELNPVGSIFCYN